MGNDIGRDVGHIVLATTQVLEIIIKSIEKRLQEKDYSYCANQMLQAAKNGELVLGRLFKPFMVDDIRKELAHQMIPHCIQQDPITNNMIVFYKADDSMKIEAVLNNFLSQNKGNVSQKFLNEQDNEAELLKVSGLSKQEFETFKFEAQKQNLAYAVAKIAEDNKVDIYLNKNTEALNKAKVVLKNIAISSVGHIAPTYESHQPERMKKIVEQAISSNNKKIISATNANHYILINKNNCSVIMNGRIVEEIEKTHSNFANKIYENAKNMLYPMVVDVNEPYSPDFLDSFKDNFNNSEDARKADIEYRVKLLVEMKLSLDNGNFSEIVTSFYDPNVTFLEFFEHELVNDMNDEEIDKMYEEMDVDDNYSAKQKLKSRALWLDKECSPEEKLYAKQVGKEIFEKYKEFAHSVTYEQKMEIGENLDDVINRAEETRDAYVGEFFEPEMPEVE